MAAARGNELSLAATRGDERNLRFVLTLTAAAALVLMMISLGIRSLNLPSGTDMSADDRRTMSIEEARQHLDQLNRAVVAPAPSTHAAPTNSASTNTLQTDANAKDAAKDQGASTLPASTRESDAAKTPVERKQ